MPLNEKQLKDLISYNSEDSVNLVPILSKHFSAKEHEEAIVSAANLLLTSSKTCVQGLELIESILVYCSPELIKQHLITWLQACIVKHEEDNTKDTKLRCLETILQYIPPGDSFNKKITAEFMLDVLKMILSSTGDSMKILALRTLVQSMIRYPSWFGNHKSKVEQFLMQILESDNRKLVQEASLSFHYFQQTGSAGVESVNYSTNFTKASKRLCATIHSLYDIVLKDVTELEIVQKPEGDHYPLDEKPTNIEYSDSKLLDVFTTRLCNCLIFLKAMIVKKYPVEKRIIPKFILDVIIRGLSVHVCILDENLSMENLQLSLILIKIQDELIKLLNVLIIGHLPGLLPFSFQINKVFLNTLKRFQTCTCFNSELKYKRCATTTFCKWIQLSSCGNLAYFQNTLIPVLKNDIVLVKKQLLLKAPVQHKKSKKRKAVADWDAAMEREPSEMSKLCKETNCINSLTILNCLLINSSLNPKTSTDFQQLVHFIVSTLSDLQAGVKNPPFDSRKCQTLLYSVLANFMRVENATSLPKAHSIAVLLRRGANDANADVKNVCKLGLELLEMLSQPVCPSLFIPDFNVGENIIGKNITKSQAHEMDLELEENVVEIPEDEDVEEVVIVEEEIVEKSDQKIKILSQFTFSSNYDLVEDPVLKQNAQFKNETVEVKDTILTLSSLPEEMNQSEDRKNEDSEEPPVKKPKEDDDLQEMCADFQDIV